MSKAANFVFGTIVGTAVGMAVGYILAPSQETTFDKGYRSRLDKALEEGQTAAVLREEELRRQFEQSKRRHTPGTTP